MQPLDLQVIKQALVWLEQGQTVWLCTVLSTWGSAPRSPGAMMVCNPQGQCVGSVSGGCVEEDLIERISQQQFSQPVTEYLYGGALAERHPDSPSLLMHSATRVQLPCGGQLQLLIERLLPTPDTLQHLREVAAALQGEGTRIRQINRFSGQRQLIPADSCGPVISTQPQTIQIRIAATRTLIIAGLSAVSILCAEFAEALGYQVVICDPREEYFHLMPASRNWLRPVLPWSYIRQHGKVHADTAIVALTHDPKIDDMAMIAAVNTEAFYIGVMGSSRTSAKRAERLSRIGKLSPLQLERIHMPVGLAIGSKTPAEIALAVMADIVAHRNGENIMYTLEKASEKQFA
ncbi:XdhC family protein [Oceanobacter mangrovi]|uniref:XdhC family protein n=1 Tax=Oceanobacter mangrovi TaxID=2862510 RepID=UPI001C8DB1F0|nr:XdhC family protein [Oceanobacter mangrovi]